MRALYARAARLVLFLVAAGAALPAPTVAAATTRQAMFDQLEAPVVITRAGATQSDPAHEGQPINTGDLVQVGRRGRAVLKLEGCQCSIRLAPLTDVLFEAEQDPSGKSGVVIAVTRRAGFYFLGREKLANVRFRFPNGGEASPTGTEFNVTVAENGRVVLTMFDGEGTLANPLGSLQLKTGEQGVIEPGQAPAKTPRIIITDLNVIQWCLYYPGVLDLNELSLDTREQDLLQASLAAYRAGDLLAALAAYPAGRQPVSAAEKVYLGALLLAVGQVEESEAVFDTLAGDPLAEEPAGPQPSPAQVAAGVRILIDVVRRSSTTNTTTSVNSATAALAGSYRLQSQYQLTEALRLAQQAVVRSPQFGLGWARVADLQFSLGHTRLAKEALAKSLALSPRNAQAVALLGFVLAAENRIGPALEQFERAIDLDGALGNAWLGRGLCRIRRGDREGGRADLFVAAILEPDRAALRSYLGKAWQLLNDTTRATHELERARELDPRDPTASLYSGLVLQQENRINEAIGELETSQELNDNRRLYRSRLLLDQDRAVRGANQASIYGDAGMTDVSVREAGKAVTADYANYSAHLLLADSYNDLREARSVNLRYETPAVSEYLIANLLAPVGAGTLSQSISQQEYSKLFERDRLGFASSTEYWSRGAWAQNTVQYGTFGNSSYALEGGYLTDPGEPTRPNNDVEQYSISMVFKQQLSAADSVYFQVITEETKGGDLLQYFDQGNANPTFRLQDTQEPILLAGYNHQWAPGSHTLFLSSRLQSELSVTDGQYSAQEYGLNQNTVLRDVVPLTVDKRYNSQLTTYTAELQQIWQGEAQTVVVGARGHLGGFDTDNQHIFDRSGSPELFAQSYQAPVSRVGVYAYDTWHALPSLQLVGGLAYDYLLYPANYRFGPIQDETTSESELLPKVGFIWQAAENSSIRFAFTRSLGGVSIDQSLRLEPTQVAGFNQAFRSIIPETLEAANAGAGFQTVDFGWEHRFPTRTYVGLTAQWLQSDVDRWVGGYRDTSAGLVPDYAVQHLDYEEQTVALHLDQLLGNQWVLGVHYRWSRADHESQYPDGLSNLYKGHNDSAGIRINEPNRVSQSGDLQQVRLQATYNHRSGVFVRTEGVWWDQQAVTDGVWWGSEQTLYGYDVPLSSFWHWNAAVGWRFADRRAEIRVSVLNILNKWQPLYPVNLYIDPPRERTFAVSFRFNF